MANWKELGEVPDSDEEDDLDSQRSEPIQDENHEAIGHDEPTPQKATQGLQEHPLEREDLGDRIGDFEKTIATGDDQPPFTALSPVNAVELHSTLKEPSLTHPTPISPKTSQVRDVVSKNGEGSSHQNQQEVPVDEEISRSYVQITSPESSQLSSLPASQLSLPSIRRFSREHGFVHALEDPSEDILLDKQTTQDTTLGFNDEALSPPRRRFRERKPIQLHPYIVENAKFQKTFRDTGLKPLRLASSQDDGRRRSRTSASPDSESQEGVSQDAATFVGGSQWTEVDSIAMPTSSPPRAIPRVNARPSNEANLSDDDDEFPDIEELLRRQNNPPSTAQKKKIKSYSTEGKRHPLSKIQTRARPADDIFDVPVSPPTTSSPYPISSRRARSSMSRLSSVSSTIQTPTTSHPNISAPQMRVDLPTPGTSALKPGWIQPLSDTSSEDEAPKTVRPDYASSPASSSDESLQLRKRLTKKIRGVLPASHLRLDQQKEKSHLVHHDHHRSLSLSPVKGVARRGVAIPRIQGAEESRPSSSRSVRLLFSDDSEGSGNDASGIVRESGSRFELDSQLDRSRLGFAEEDDRIDAMLPSRKRPSVSSRPNLYKKRRVGSGTMNLGGNISSKWQPRITEHLSKSSGTNKSSHRAMSRSRQDNFSRRAKRPSYPRLGILDLTDKQRNGDLPDFVKVAARAARRKKGQGRQSPSRKFIRLATREDTQDVQSVFEDWKGGRIRSRIKPATHQFSDGESRHPLQQIDHNRQAAVSDTVPKSRNNTYHNVLNSAMPRKLHISRGQQQSMNDFVLGSHEAHPRQEQHPTNQMELAAVQSHQRKSRSINQPVRPAQLEASEVEYSYRYPITAFKTTKRALDALYRKNRKQHVPRANVQLSRFLENEDAVQPTIETDQMDVDTGISNVDTLPGIEPAKATRRKKRTPQRLDANAARYRQPSDPLIIDYLITTQAPDTATGDIKMTGLGKLGTRYTYHFDIFPLQPGIFFHENTLIGQGRLSEIVNDSLPLNNGFHRPHTVLRLGERTFTWGAWDGAVSSEVGICFDWIAEQLLSVSPESLALDTNYVSVTASLLEYMHNHSPLKGSSDLKSFLGRMVEVISDFSSRLRAGGNRAEHATQNDTKQIDVLSICVLLVLQLLRIARIKEESNLGWELEENLKSIAGLCIDSLLGRGLDGIRRLYDDLQYLSFRESGIKNDQRDVQAWVILIKTMAAANIPRGSFWDVLNPRLLQRCKTTSDTPTLEKSWYSMFSLLPLCEFDEFGLVHPGKRQSASFDNWQLPQQLMKRVTSLYESNPKQPPGFNDYCRSLFARCHYLMIHWGWWKCSTIIGSLFDFFASQKLANLRNEEVHVSPRFLRELDTLPNLDVEPEDRCFHIFLKMVALAITHLRNAKDVKMIRNLVARLLPNHNRQYSKNEGIHQRDLASLRNHHDLLCTMYWAAPASERPALALIQELVVAGHSHNEACLINLRAWENLARFMVTNSSDPESYEPLRQWQTSFFSSLCQQYLGQEDEVRQQAETIQSLEGEPMTESRISEIVTANMRSTIVPMCMSIAAMGAIIKVAKSDSMVKQALNCDVLAKALNPELYANRRIAESLVNDCLHVICNYIDRIQHAHPPHAAQSNAKPVEGDSQDSLDMAAFAADWERSELIHPLQHSVIDATSSVLRIYLESQSEDTKEPMTTFRFVECWARLVSLVTENEVLHLAAFLTKGRHSVFENRDLNKVANNYWPLFLAKLLQNTNSLDDFKVSGFNIGLEWLLSLLKPQAIGWPEQSFSTQLHAKGHYLCSHVELHASNRTYMIRGAIRKMGNLLMNKTTEAEIGLSAREAKRLFSDMLGEVMRTMQRSLESLEPASETHKDFVEIVQLIVADIKCYASDIEPLIEFFVHPSTYYWPPETDPNLYGAGLVSYCIKLGTQYDKTSWELFYYLHSGWKNAVISGSTDNYVNCIKKGLKRWDFCKFMLAEVLPAILGAGFSADGWILCSTFLPPLSNPVARLLEPQDSKSEWVFENLVNMLRIIMNGVIAQTRRAGGSRPSNGGVVAVAMRFWFSISAPMRQYVERHPEKMESLSEATDPLTHFICHAIQSFGSEEPEFWHPTGELDVRKGKYYDKFVKIFVQDIKDNWEFEDGSGEKVVIKAARSKEKSTVQEFGVTLKEILEREMHMYQVLFPSEHEVHLPERRNHFINDVYV